MLHAKLARESKQEDLTTDDLNTDDLNTDDLNTDDLNTEGTSDETDAIRAIADHVVALAKAGDFDTIGEIYWDDDVISFEAGGGPMAVCEGIAAVRAKSAWWSDAHEVHGGDAHGPWVNGDQFTVRFTMDVTVKASTERIQMDEIALYTVDEGMIIEERFFY